MKSRSIITLIIIILFIGFAKAYTYNFTDYDNNRIDIVLSPGYTDYKFTSQIVLNKSNYTEVTNAYLNITTENKFLTANTTMIEETTSSKKYNITTITNINLSNIYKNIEYTYIITLKNTTNGTINISKNGAIHVEKAVVIYDSTRNYFTLGSLGSTADTNLYKTLYLKPYFYLYAAKTHYSAWSTDDNCDAWIKTYDINGNLVDSIAHTDCTVSGCGAGYDWWDYFSINQRYSRVTLQTNGDQDCSIGITIYEYSTNGFIPLINISVSNIEEKPDDKTISNNYINTNIFLEDYYNYSESLNNVTTSNYTTIYTNQYNWMNYTISNWSYIYYYSIYNNSDHSYSRYYWFAPNCTVFEADSTSNINLWSIGDEDELYPTDLVTVTIYVKDTDGGPVSDAIVKVLKDMGDGTYETVEVSKTNSEGVATARLIAYRTLYKFIIEKDCVSLMTTSPTNIYESSLTITVPTSILSGDNPWFQLYQNLFIYYNLTYNDTDWRLTFSDPSNTEKTHCLEVWIDEYPTKRLNSSTCIVASSGSIELPFIANTSQEAIYKVENIPITTKKYTYTDNRRELFKDVGGIFISLLFQALIIGISMTIGSPLFFFYASPIVTIASYHLGILPVSAGIAYAYSLIILIIGIISTYRRGS